MMMTRFMQALRYLLDALRDSPETPEVEEMATVFTAPSKPEVHSRFLK
jgi:hypothetical protein